MTEESAMQRSYGKWAEHAQECEQCKSAPSAADGCEKGRELWGVYRLARIGTNTGGGA